jgi:hypothetical protein
MAEVPRAELVDDRLSTLISVVSQLAENMHMQQLCLNQLREAFHETDARLCWFLCWCS